MTVLNTSAVDSFARWHEDPDHDEPNGRYRALLPASAPRPGEQYRFEVDLDRCSGCKACVSACHSLNGLDSDETWRAVGLLVGGNSEGPGWTQHVTTACHHCVEPACLKGCPVEAYEKDPVSGIVAHLDDQCIGCRYCMLMCPYEVPRFNERLGVVRKCDMCSERLAEGEAPACVQGCPTDAISIGIVDTAAALAQTTADGELRLVPTAPRSALTTPTTVYLTRRDIPSEVVAADDHRLEPATNHPPLVAMLVLTQVSVGAVLVALLGARLGGWFGTSADAGVGPAVASWATALVAICASIGHLGRPLVAWRAVLGIGHSWLSREIVAFGAYAALGAGGVAAATNLVPGNWELSLSASTALAGMAGIWCSAELYATTGREAWRLDRTVARFVLTTLVGGASIVAATAAVATMAGADGIETDAVVSVCGVVVAAGTTGGIVVGIAFIWRHRSGDGPLARSAHLLSGALRADTRRCVSAASIAVLLAVTLVLGDWSPGWRALWSLFTVASVLVATWWERRLFFVSVAPDRMPGGFH